MNQELKESIFNCCLIICIICVLIAAGGGILGILNIIDETTEWIGIGIGFFGVGIFWLGFTIRRG